MKSESRMNQTVIDRLLTSQINVNYINNYTNPNSDGLTTTIVEQGIRGG